MVLVERPCALLFSACSKIQNFLSKQNKKPQKNVIVCVCVTPTEIASVNIADIAFWLCVCAVFSRAA